MQEFTAAQAYGKDISVRVRRTTPKAKENARDTVYLLAVQTTCYGAGSDENELVAAPPLVTELRDKCSRIGIRVRSTNATDGHLDSFSVIVSGCARTWDSINHLLLVMCAVNTPGLIINAIQYNKLLSGKASGIWIK